MRQPILYADQMWRRNRLLALLVIVMGLFFLWADHPNLAHPIFNTQLVTALLYGPAGLLMAGLFLYNRWRNRIELTDKGLRVRTIFSSVEIAYEAIRQARVQPLEKAYSATAAKRLPPYVKPLLPRPALFVRLRGREEESAAMVRRLGSRYVIDGEIVLPVPNPEAVADAISGKLPRRPGPAGSRRRRR